MIIVQGAFTISPIYDRPLQIGERMEEEEEEKEEKEEGDEEEEEEGEEEGEKSEEGEEEVFLTSTSSGLQLYGGLHNP